MNPSFLAGLSSPAAPVAGPDLGELSYSVIGEAPLDVRMTKLFRAVTLSIHDPRALAKIRAMNTAARCGSDPLCCLNAGLWGLRAIVRYEPDPEDVDRYAPYMVSVDTGSADCSSMTAAVDAHAYVSGMPVGARTIKQRNHKTGLDEWCHVYGLAVLPDGRVVPVDMSERYVPVGWEPQRWRVVDFRDWMYDASTWDRWYRNGAKEDALPLARPSRPL